MISLSTSLVGELGFDAAIAEEAAWQPDLVPYDVACIYASQHPDKFSELIQELALAPLDVGRAEILSASKWRYGRRPVAILPIQERIIYRAMVNLLKEELQPVIRGREAYRAFENAPLDDGAQYIVVTDIANFYSSIPLELLSRELVDRCGRWEPIQWLSRFWALLSGSGHGIPQGSGPSHCIGDTYADELHRRLLRRGLHAWRYADDFRIAAPSRTVAIEYLDVLDEEANKLGIFINERKTSIPKAEQYKSLRSLDPDDVSEQELQGDIVDLLNADPYEAHADTNSDKLDDLIASAKRFIDMWSGGELPTGENSPVAMQLQISTALRKSLTILGIVFDAHAVPHSGKILDSDPQLTPSVATYLASLSGMEPFIDVGVKGQLKAVISSMPLTKWQQYWLMYAVGGPYGPDPRGLAADDKELLDWTRSHLNDRNEVVRAQALWTLTSNHAASLDDWRSISQRQSRLSSPLTATCLRHINVNGEKPEDMLSTAKLDRLVYNWPPDDEPLF